MGQITEKLLQLVSEFADGKPTVFAKKAGIPHSTFLTYLKGRVPHMEHIIRIHDTYGVDLNWLLVGKMEKQECDKNRLRAAIETIETALKETERIMESDKKATLILSVYDFFQGGDQKEIKDKIIQLIKLAG